MAVKLKSLRTKDRFSKASQSTVHYIKVNKSNRKGVAEAVGGTLVDHPGHSSGDFHINVKQKVRGKWRELNLFQGVTVFRTNNNQVWQIGNTAYFKARFPNAKF